MLVERRPPRQRSRREGVHAPRTDRTVNSRCPAGYVPWIKLEVTASRDSGVLSGVNTLQRINAVGGKHVGACGRGGKVDSAPPAAEYVFLKK
jgi:hypothetical protein